MNIANRPQDGRCTTTHTGTGSTTAHKPVQGSLFSQTQNVSGFLACYYLVGLFLYPSVVTVDCMGFPCYAIHLFVMPVCSEQVSDRFRVVVCSVINRTARGSGKLHPQTLASFTIGSPSDLQVIQWVKENSGSLEIHFFKYSVTKPKKLTVQSI